MVRSLIDPLWASAGQWGFSAPQKLFAVRRVHHFPPPTCETCLSLGDVDNSLSPLSSWWGMPGLRKGYKLSARLSILLPAQALGRVLLH